MNENKTFSVQVSTTSAKKIGVSSNVSKNEITASADTGLYYSQLAKNWAIGEGLIENTDYSSKAYAQESKAYALDSKAYSESASLDLGNLNNKIIEYEEQLNDTVATGLSEISVLQADSLAEIEANKISALNSIETNLNNATSEIQNIANSSIEDINAIGIDTKVSKSGDTMTGSLYVPTPDYTDNSTRVATTEFVNSVVPTGTVISSASSSTPTGYLYCNGSEVSRTTYAKLFNAIGTTYGTGDGSTTFNLPNYSGYKFVTSATVSVKGSGKTLGLTDGTLTGGMTTNKNYAAYGLFQKGAYNVNVGTAVTPGSTNDWTNNNKSIGVTTDASKSGLTGSVNTQTLKWYIKY